MSSYFTGIRRYPDRGWVAGVCAGIADHFDWNVKLVRAIFFLSLCFSGFFPVGLLYGVLWYVLDEPGQADEGGSARAAYSPSPSPAPPGARRGDGDVQARFARLEQRLRGLEESVSSRDFELRREFRKLES